MPNFNFNPEKYKKEIVGIVEDLLADEIIIKTVGANDHLSLQKEKRIEQIVRKHPMDGNKVFSRDKIVAGIDWLVKNNPVEVGRDLPLPDLKQLRDAIKLKPTRTISGVTTVTVLTKPFFCPGQCVFCPNDVRMPKSYIATEPGAQRALRNRFSPYLQTYNRLKALRNIGHPTSKIELLVLGGTWSSYPTNYQIWFIHQCFKAMNDFAEGIQDKNEALESIDEYLKNDYNDELRKELGDMPYNKIIKTEKFQKDFARFTTFETRFTWEDLNFEHVKNSKSDCRCVGLVLETRPDAVSYREAANMRRLGATKIQLGIQTLDDQISKLNRRGEDRTDTSKAFNILRQFGFKIHAHIMPNLYGATPEGDLRVYKELFENPNYKPDEVKIYPTSIIKNTELYDLFLARKYKPYSTEELTDLIAKCMEMTPEYCRLTRIIRDIPSTEIEAGNKTTNLRQVVELKMKKENMANPNIRAREIKGKKVRFDDLSLDIIEYDTEVSTEYFLQYITKKREIAGFLRLSLPKRGMGYEAEGITRHQTTDNKEIPTVKTSPNPILLGGELKGRSTLPAELANCAMIREVHVYGPSLELNKDSSGQAQHLGLGTKLIEKAKEITKENNFEKLAVISAIGTREYYEKRGFNLVEMYQVGEL